MGRKDRGRQKRHVLPVCRFVWSQLQVRESELKKQLVKINSGLVRNLPAAGCFNYMLGNAWSRCMEENSRGNFESDVRSDAVPNTEVPALRGARSYYFESIAMMCYRQLELPKILHLSEAIITKLRSSPERISFTARPIIVAMQLCKCSNPKSQIRNQKTIPTYPTKLSPGDLS
jgi:hypothetical protein